MRCELLCLLSKLDWVRAEARERSACAQSMVLLDSGETASVQYIPSTYINKRIKDGSITTLPSIEVRLAQGVAYSV